MSRVVVVGGGPAGASAAGLLARHGVEVTVVERAAFPRHHVGESLQPACIQLLDAHLGIGPAIAAAGFARKYGAVYVWGENRTPWTVLFDDRLEGQEQTLTEEALLAGDFEHAFQVDRARFDTILLDAATSAGAVLHAGEVMAPRLEGDRVTALALRDGTELTPELVIDASGQRCLLGRSLGLTRVVDDMRATATYAYYEGAGGYPGALGRHVQWVVTTEDGWCWFIPISPTQTSVGVVTRDRRILSGEAFDAAIARAGFPLDTAVPLPNPTGSDHRWFAQDWSFSNTRFAGENWLMAGDAGCFVDPILSGGVDMAVRTGFRAGLTALRALEGEDWSALAAAYEDEFRREYKAYLRLARYWYGNNRSVEGLFWEAHAEIPPQATATPLRAFVYLTTGQYAAERHFKVFASYQEQKMFRQLGVDAEALRRARAQRPK